ncbi:LacI family transcriptional regulator [Capsulimonas corticalis]|uniref:LacI family transcriptional regulator n=1 Tax=Capsulimonas corticalis TaxID=2219043 RepID=A0A402CVR9_9BACT|nr:LacI family DNA-binding transcriptional regulator [Capsulimonas corticalis]BDI30509.1 LacI family transcriptional regulator [Capsulimonas corticalis]
MAVSIRDVASRAGVSFTTVSKVLNERPGDRTAPETRLRVVQAAQELGYRPNAVAQSLRSRTTDIIGFYTGLISLDIMDPFHGAVLNGLQHGCEEHHKDLLIHRKFFGDSPEEIYKDLSNRKVDGIVLPSGCDDEIVQRLKASSFPAVGLAAPDAGLSSVYVDSVHGFRLVAAHLAEKGHRRVLYRTQRRDPEIKIEDSERRCHAFAAASAAYGMEVLVTEAPEDGVVTEEEKSLLLAPPSKRPTAVACWNDRYAHQMMTFCRRHGLQTPGDLAVAGFDGFTLPYDPAYQLTTVRAPWEECARTAIGLVVTMTGGNPVPDETVLPVELIHGDTT